MEELSHFNGWRTQIKNMENGLIVMGDLSKKNIGLIVMGDCCDVAVTQINNPSFKHNTQDNIEQARGWSHKEDSSQIFMLNDMQFGGGWRYLG